MTRLPVSWAGDTVLMMWREMEELHKELCLGWALLAFLTFLRVSPLHNALVTLLPVIQSVNKSNWK